MGSPLGCQVPWSRWQKGLSWTQNLFLGPLPSMLGAGVGQ